MQSLVGQSPLEDTIGTHAPVAFPAPRGHVHFFAGDTQREQMASARSRLLPLLPVVQSHPSPNPLRQFRHHRVGLADLEVVDPARDVPVQFVDDVLHPVAPVAPGDWMATPRIHPPTNRRRARPRRRKSTPPLTLLLL